VAQIAQEHGRPNEEDDEYGQKDGGDDDGFALKPYASANVPREWARDTHAGV